MPFATDFAPQQISDLILPQKHIGAKLRQYATFSKNDHLLLFGPAGTAKTTTAELIAKLRDAHSGLPHQRLIFDGSDWDAHSIDEIDNFWALQKTNGLSVPACIINEVDELSIPHQNKLRAYLSQRQGQLCVILTTNHVGKLREPLKDRCVQLHMPKINIPDWLPRVQQYLAANNVVLPDAAVLAVINTSNGSVRDLSRVIDDLAAAHHASVSKPTVAAAKNQPVKTA